MSHREGKWLAPETEPVHENQHCSRASCQLLVVFVNNPPPPPSRCSDFSPCLRGTERVVKGKGCLSLLFA